MSTNSSSQSSGQSLIHANAFLRSLLAPLVLWAGLVILISLQGMPGVVCVTPLAWTLALWSGVRYIQLSDGSPGRIPLLGPAILGALLGLVMGILFALVSVFGMPATSPGDWQKMVVLIVIIVLIGTLICAGLSVFTAWLTLRHKQ